MVAAFVAASASVAASAGGKLLVQRQPKQPSTDDDVFRLTTDAHFPPFRGKSALKFVRRSAASKLAKGVFFCGDLKEGTAPW